MKRAAWLAVLLGAVMGSAAMGSAAMARAAMGSSTAGSPGDPGSWVERLREIPPDSAATWQVAVRENTPAFRAAVESLLVQEDLRDPVARSRLESAGAAYCKVTRDSVLLSDVSFLASVEPSVREHWARAVDLDRRGYAIRSSDPASAIPLLEDAIRIYADIGHLRREAVAWGSLGTAAWSLGDRARAGDCYRKALVLRERLGDRLWIGRALNTLGSAKFDMAEYDSALIYYGRARAVREAIGHKNDLALTLAYTGNVHYRRADLLAARECYLSALRIAGPGASTEVNGSAWVGLANVHSDLGEVEEASALYRKALALREAAGQARETAVIRSNLAKVMSETGDYAGALAELERARATFEELGDRFHLAEALRQAGSVRARLGDFSQAEKLWSAGLEEAQASENTVEIANALLNLGYAYDELGATERCLESLRRAAALADSLGDQRLRRDALSKMGTALQHSGNFERALELHGEALSLDRAAGFRELAAIDHTNVGYNELSLGRREAGLASLREGADLARELESPEVLWSVTVNIADAFESAGELDSARAYNERAVETLESVNIVSVGEEGKAEFLRARSFVYEALVHVLAQLHAREPDRGLDREAWAVAERGKARALLDILEEARVDLSAGADSGLQAERSRRGRELNAAGYKLRRAQDSGASPDSLRELRKAMEAVEAEIRRTEDRLRFTNPELASLDLDGRIDLDMLRTTLLATDGSLLLEYVLGDSGSYLWAITREEARMFALPSQSVIQEQAQRLRRALARPEGDRGRAVGSPAGVLPWQPEAAALRDMILRPAREELDGAKDVYIVPDRALQYVPFEVLLCDAGEKGTSCSFAKKAIRYGPSAAVLVQLGTTRLPGARTERKDFLGVGDPRFSSEATGSLGTPEVDATRAAQKTGLTPLPFTRAEVEASSSCFPPGKAQLLLGSEAREATLIEPGFLSQFRIVHFATHGLIDERLPMRSALVLSDPQDPSEDGFLAASEIYRLRLDADLVVLSACETGMGKMVRGEGVLGLPRALLFAGADNVVMSLWSVSDEATAGLMARFYEEMTDGKRPPAEALARAKVAMLESERWNHPFYWAGFVFLGPGRQF